MDPLGSNFLIDLIHILAKLGHDRGELGKMRGVPEAGEMAKKKRICETAARKRFVKSVNHATIIMRTGKVHTCKKREEDPYLDK